MNAATSALTVAGTGFPWLTVAGGIPLAGAALVAAGPVRLSKLVTLASSVITLVWVIVMAIRFNPSGPTFQFTEQYSWIPQFGVHYALGVDGIALVLIGMSVVLMPVVVLASWHDADTVPSRGGTPPDPPTQRSPKTYFALMLVLETMMIGVFAATDVFLFYVFFEAMLIPMYFMIGSLRRRAAAVRGGQVPAVQPARRPAHAGRGDRAVRVLRAVRGPPGTTERSCSTRWPRWRCRPTVQKWLFLGFFIAFAIKAPLWPFHTWLPDAATSAQPGAAVLLVGVLDKVGTFGMIRYCLELFPAGFHYFTPLVLVLAVISVIYGAIVAIGQTSMKRLIGYTSISHFGFIVLGIFALTSQGQSGATLYMVNHGFATGALLLLAGFLIVRRGSDKISDYGGVQKVAPVLAGLFLISGLQPGLSLPGLSTFVSEFLVLVGTFSRYKVAGSFAVAGIVLAAIYILWMYQRTMNGPVAESVAGMRDLRPRELLAVAPLVALIIALGVYPKPVLDLINPAVKSTMSQVHATDPVPAVPAVAQKGNQP